MSRIDLTPRLRLAADYIDKHGWIQGQERDDQGHVCLTGAIRRCAPQNGDGEIIRAVMRMKGVGEEWNDDEPRTESEVLEVLRSTEITDTDLEVTFGPQWVEIVALVRRDATLTDAVYAVLTAACGGWFSPAWDSSCHHAAMAGLSGAWDAVVNGTRYATRDAAQGLVVRHLIAPDGFTQGHYNTLTKPWAAIIGKVHPDD